MFAMYKASKCSVDMTGSAVINNRDVLQTDWTVTAGHSVVSHCPSAADSHGAISRFDNGLTASVSKCVNQLPARMTSPVTDCQGMNDRPTTNLSEGDGLVFWTLLILTYVLQLNLCNLRYISVVTNE